jgi:hypothetical protein
MRELCFPFSIGSVSDVTVKPRPPHRSITFWSGILVIAFLCWAWWRSVGHSDSIGVNRYGISNTHSHLHIEVNRFPIWENWPWNFHHSPMPPEFRKTAFPMPGRQVVTGAPVTRMHLFIPHWLILLVVATPWCGLLLWQRWRSGRARAAAAIYETPP